MEKLIEALLILFVGMTSVFLSLLFFYIVIFMIREVDEKLNNFLVQKKLVPTKLDTEKAQIKPEIVAAISAAAYQTFHQPVKIKKIHFLDDSSSREWAVSGRINIMGSHNIKK
jgi:Na+-transporting methylmalonyl-CoA/oxaloacetate decarboxylase gamma subunit